MSSSHLYRRLPMALLVLYLVLSPGFQSAPFLSLLSLGKVAVLCINFHFFVSLVPASNLCAFHLFYGFFSDSLYVFIAVFFFD